MAITIKVLDTIACVKQIYSSSSSARSVMFSKKSMTEVSFVTAS